MRPRLFFQVVGVEARKRMAYRVDFWLQAVVGLVVEVALVWFLWQALFRESGQQVVAGWDLSMTVLYYVVAILVARLVRGNDLDGDSVSSDVYEGGLNRYLLYPASYVAFKYAQKLGSVGPAAVQCVLFGALLPWLFPAATSSVSLGSLGMGLASIAVGSLLYFLMTLPLHAVAFWADNVWSLVVALRLVSGVLGGAALPLSVFPAWSQPWLDALPFRHCFWTPVNVLLGRVDGGTWLADLGLGLLWCGLFAGVGAVLLARGRYRYSGVGI